MKIALVDYPKILQLQSPSPVIRTISKDTAGLKYGFRDKVKDVIANAENYHSSYYEAGTFRGPSLYFHERALATRYDQPSLKHLEYVYATLASWGMHRMGSGGSKMHSFEVLLQSVHLLKNRIVEAQTFDYREMSETKWAVIEEIFSGIKVMASATTIVGNSKVMHHMLPNIVPPIDREYTLRYLFNTTGIKNDLTKEWQLMKEIISEFFIPVASDISFSFKVDQWMKNRKNYPWDTSAMKVVDNLIIGSRK